MINNCVFQRSDPVAHRAPAQKRDVTEIVALTQPGYQFFLAVMQLHCPVADHVQLGVGRFCRENLRAAAKVLDFHRAHGARNFLVRQLVEGPMCCHELGDFR